MKIKRRIKRTTRQYFIVALICIVVIGGAAIFTSAVVTGQIKEEYQALLTKAHYDIKINQRNVYVATSEIMGGNYITEDNVEKKTVYASQPEKIYITDKDIGKIALVDIPVGTQLINSMLTDKEISSELRELEYNVIYISSNIANNDTVDVRISYPNGENYVVLSKKAIKGVVSETATCYLWLEEEELLRMSAAIVDAGLYSGTKLSVTKYVEPNIQQASAVTYTPSLSILALLESDPNIVERYSQELNKEVRKALENRLAKSMETDVSAISWDTNSNDNILPATSPVATPTHTPQQLPMQTPTQTQISPPTQLPTTSQTPFARKDEVEEQEDNSELGSVTDYLFYAEEKIAGEGDIEYGE